ncbi:MAG: hypothetical protein R2697_15100 [Ilumatobacteraceae bacterium]
MAPTIGPPVTRIHEPTRIVRLLMSLWRRWPDTWSFEPALVGGFPGIVIEMEQRAR